MVVVCDQERDSIAAALRAGWLREVHPDVDVRVIYDRYPADDSALWARLAIEWLGRAPDVVFTSETYGDVWAEHLGCRHVCVDLARKDGRSATAVRADPFGRWDDIEPCVRAHYALRVVVVGAESTGTTTLAQDLAAAYGTNWVPEYGREYSETRPGGLTTPWATDEFCAIADEQNRREDLAAREANRILICDTDSFATGIWHERYMGKRSSEVEQRSLGRRVDLHILTGDEIPFVQDGLRDGEHLRGWMNERFRAALEERGGHWIEVAGSPEDRLASAQAAIEQRMAQHRPAITPPSHA